MQLSVLYKEYNLPTDLESFRTRILQLISNQPIGIICAGESIQTFDKLVRVTARKGIGFIS
jgi:hypothetical protein